MTTRARIRPSRKSRSAKTPRGQASAQGGKKQGAGADRFSNEKGRAPASPNEPLVQSHIRTFGIHVNENTRTSIRQKLETKFGKFARSIERMSVRLEDVNGPRGGVDHLCRIKVVLRNLPSVVYENQDASLDTAVGGALAGAERAVRRTLQRAHSKPVKKQPRSDSRSEI